MALVVLAADYAGIACPLNPAYQREASAHGNHRPPASPLGHAFTELLPYYITMSFACDQVASDAEEGVALASSSRCARNPEAQTVPAFVFPCGVVAHSPLVLECIDLVAINVPIPSDRACILSFPAIRLNYVGPESRFDDGVGHVLGRGLPIDVCDKTVKLLLASKADIVATASTFHYDRAGTC